MNNKLLNDITDFENTSKKAIKELESMKRALEVEVSFKEFMTKCDDCNELQYKCEGCCEEDRIYNEIPF